jgi:hypothetical protein
MVVFFFLFFILEAQQQTQTLNQAEWQRRMVVLELPNTITVTNAGVI